MSEPTDQVRVELNREDRKALLVLACTADRAAWTNACRPVPPAPMQRFSNIVRLIEPVLAFLPGRLGRLARSVKYFAHLGEQFMRLRS
jgi:hypothetical protein